MQITLKREHGVYCSDRSWWLATVQVDGYEATGTGWYRKLAARRAVRKLDKAAAVRETLSVVVNIAEREAKLKAAEEQCAAWAAGQVQAKAPATRKRRTAGA